jgi:hypothetical protein
MEITTLLSFFFQIHFGIAWTPLQFPGFHKQKNNKRERINTIKTIPEQGGVLSFRR